MTEAFRFPPMPAGHDKSAQADTQPSRVEGVAPYAGPTGSQSRAAGGIEPPRAPYVPRPFRERPKEQVSYEVFPSVAVGAASTGQDSPGEVAASGAATSSQELPWIDAYLDESGVAPSALPEPPAGAVWPQESLPEKPVAGQVPTAAAEAAAVLEELARQLRVGSLPITGFMPGMGDAAALAATLTAVLGRGR